MQNINLNEKWIMLTQQPNNLFVEPSCGEVISFPYDAFITRGRMFAMDNGHENGYYPSVVTHFFKRLPAVETHTKVFLTFDGLCGHCDIYIGGVYVSSTDSRELHYVDITDYYKKGELLALRIASSSDAGKYIGNGIAGSISLCAAKEDFYIKNGSIKVNAAIVDGKGAIELMVDVVNAGETQYAHLYTEIYNAKNKRITKRGKRVKLIAGKTKTYGFKIRLARAFEWTPYDPYIYSTKVTIKPLETEFEPENASASTFGIVSHSLAGRSYRVAGKQHKLKGVVMAHDNGFVGSASLASAEMRKLGEIKNLGYNAVRYIGCPTQMALDTMDKLGLVCVVDIFDKLAQGNHSADGHANFKNTYKATIENTVKALRNHPCVAFYSVCNDASETYGRGDGYALLKDIIDQIKIYDSKTFITGNAMERELLPSELSSVGVRYNEKSNADDAAAGSMAAGREKDAFGKLIAPYYEMLDVAGYTNLSERFISDIKASGKLVMSLAEDGSKIRSLYDGIERVTGVVGGFTTYGADFNGSCEKANGESGNTVACINTSGNLDFTLKKKSLSYYKQIVNGAKNCSFMVVQDPDAYAVSASDNFSKTYPLWNWPRHVGQNVKVVVYTSGEIVALYQDGKQIGRKIAGKFNNHMAVFNVAYTPGKLEAVSFHKGVECARTMLETTMPPKAIKLETVKKTVLEGDTFYIDVRCVDKENKVVGYASRIIDVEIEGDGELIAAASADPYNDLSAARSSVALCDGYASLVLKATNSGKIFVKVGSEGLRVGKITIKVK